MQRRDEKKPTTTFSKLAGAGVAGAAEIAIFHPIDTVIKRLQKNKTTITTPAMRNAVIFADAKDGDFVAKSRSLYTGLLSASGYKIAQRTLKFGGQPIIHDYLDNNLSESNKQWLGNVGQRALAGSFAGVSEIIILPFDVMKIKRQTGAYTEKGVMNLGKYLYAENIRLYKGAITTAARNAPGSFLLFGGEAMAMQHLFGVKNPKDATFSQKIAAATVGTTASIIGTLPLDVIKTRIQAAKGKQETKAMQILTDMAKNEGAGSFFKGWLPKTAAAGPKVVFTMLLAPTIADHISTTFKP
jgi:hypothetical protein